MPSRLSSKTKSFNFERFKSKNSKSQAAMEFLMTYGWALLVVLIAIAALAYFGLLNPSKFLPDKVTIAPGLTVREASIDENTVVLAVSNGLGDTLRDFVVTVDNCNGESASSLKYSTFKAGETKLIAIPCDTSEYSNSKFKSNIVVNYTTKVLNNELTHSKKGELNWQTQEGTDAVTEYVDEERNELIQSFDFAGTTYTTESNPIVINSTHGHIWQASDSSSINNDACWDGSDGCLIWSNAILYCQNLKMCGDGTYKGNHTTVGDCSSNGGDLFTDWRLPSGDDSYTAGLDYSSYQSGIEGSSYFTDGTGFDAYDYYWTGTSHNNECSSTNAYFVDFFNGSMSNDGKDNGFYDRARCVRDQ